MRTTILASLAAASTIAGVTTFGILAFPPAEGTTDHPDAISSISLELADGTDATAQVSDAVTITAEWAVTEDTVAGETFELILPPELAPDTGSTPLTDDQGRIAGECTVDTAVVSCMVDDDSSDTDEDDHEGAIDEGGSTGEPDGAERSGALSIAAHAVAASAGPTLDFQTAAGILPVMLPGGVPIAAKASPPDVPPTSDDEADDPDSGTGSAGSGGSSTNGSDTGGYGPATPSSSTGGAPAGTPGPDPESTPSPADEEATALPTPRPGDIADVQNPPAAPTATTETPDPVDRHDEAEWPAPGTEAGASTTPGTSEVRDPLAEADEHAVTADPVARAVITPLITGLSGALTLTLVALGVTVALAIGRRRAAG